MPSFDRRQFLSTAAIALPGSTWLPALAAAAADHPDRKRACIVLWMSGGPTQTDTFDPKPEHANGGPFKAIETAAPGIRIGEHLPSVAKELKHLAVRFDRWPPRKAITARQALHLQTGTSTQGAFKFHDVWLTHRQRTRTTRGRSAGLRQHHPTGIRSRDVFQPASPRSAIPCTPRWWLVAAAMFSVARQQADCESRIWVCPRRSPKSVPKIGANCSMNWKPISSLLVRESPRRATHRRISGQLD